MVSVLSSLFISKEVWSTTLFKTDNTLCAVLFCNLITHLFVMVFYEHILIYIFATEFNEIMLHSIISHFLLQHHIDNFCYFMFLSVSAPQGLNFPTVSVIYKHSQWRMQIPALCATPHPTLFKFLYSLCLLWISNMFTVFAKLFFCFSYFYYCLDFWHCHSVASDITVC